MTEAGSEPVTDSDPADNTFADGTVKVRIRGDIDGNGVVNMLDLWLVSRHFGFGSKDEGWNPDADLNLDGWVDMLDMYLTTVNFGKACP